MSTKNSLMVIALLLALTLGVSLMLGNQMPEQMASHWNDAGQVDGYSDKNTALFLVPGMELGLVLLLFGVPMIDPRKENIQKFRPLYNVFVIVTLGFMSYIHLLTLLWNLGWNFDLVFWMIPAFAVLLYFAGVLMGKAQSNWFIGIRTPWTLSDNRVWEQTHRIGGITFKVCGAISLVGLIFPRLAIWFLLVPLLGTAFGLILYSYLYYRSLHKGLA